MLELGRAGTAGAGTGTVPVLRDGVLVGTLRASAWKEAATATVGSGSWGLLPCRARAHRSPRRLRRRRVPGPDDVAVDRHVGAGADGTAVEGRTTSWWRGARRYTAGGRTLAESSSTGRLRRPTLTAVEDLSLEAQVFLLWVELVVLRRSGGAAAGAAVASGAA